MLNNLLRQNVTELVYDNCRLRIIRILEDAWFFEQTYDGITETWFVEETEAHDTLTVFVEDGFEPVELSESEKIKIKSNVEFSILDGLF